MLASLWLAVNVSSRWYPTPDSTGYLSIARELAYSGELRNLNSPHIYYPVGYSLLLAPLFSLSDEPFWLVMVLHFGLALGLLWMVYRWVGLYFPQHAAWVALATVANTSFGNIYRRTLGETAFMLAWMLTGWAFARCARSGRGWVLAALAFVALVLLRPAGAMLAAGFGAVLMLGVVRGERRWWVAGLLTLAVLPAAGVQAAWMIRDRHAAEVAGELTYSEQLREVGQSWAGQLMEGVRLRIQESGRLLLPGFYRAYARSGEWFNINMLLYCPLAVLVLLGWGKAIRRHRDIHIWALPAYVGLYVIWPYDQTTRFFTPIFPMLVLCVLVALERLPTDPLRRGALVFAALHLAVALGYWLLDERRQNDRLAARVPTLRAVAEFVPPDDRQRVAISSAGQDEHPWLSFLLNRPVFVWDAEKPAELPTRVCWLLLHDKDQPPPGFVSVAIPGLQRLHQRQAIPPE